jgi:aminoglycoside phosphotransferase (APT) family kinase protein
MNSSDVSADSSNDSTASIFSPADLSLIVGDLWPNSVLIDPLQRTVWIVDWEAAQIGRPGRDVALLVDHLWIMTQNPSKYDAVRAQKLIQSFASVFFPACRASADAAPHVDWRLGREPEFLRSVAMFAGSPHYGIDHSAALRRALEEISALSGLGIAQ